MSGILLKCPLLSAKVAPSLSLQNVTAVNVLVSFYPFVDENQRDLTVGANSSPNYHGLGNTSLWPIQLWWNERLQSKTFVLGSNQLYYFFGGHPVVRPSLFIAHFTTFNIHSFLLVSVLCFSVFHSCCLLRKCWRRLSCMSSTFHIATMNGLRFAISWDELCFGWGLLLN